MLRIFGNGFYEFIMNDGLNFIYPAYKITKRCINHDSVFLSSLSHDIKPFICVCFGSAVTYFVARCLIKCYHIDEDLFQIDDIYTRFYKATNSLGNMLLTSAY